MRRTLAGSGGAIMTSRTGARHSGMVKVHIGPTAGDVAIIAHITGR